ncbi:hypothetical protein J6590_026452 [Homalodisca vitripennis]|nr:hypothetical protein J6590_026452 [Homalodisca vitripennis]
MSRSLNIAHNYTDGCHRINPTRGGCQTPRNQQIAIRPSPSSWVQHLKYDAVADLTPENEHHVDIRYTQTIKHSAIRCGGSVLSFCVIRPRLFLDPSDEYDSRFQESSLVSDAARRPRLGRDDRSGGTRCLGSGSDSDSPASLRQLDKHREGVIYIPARLRFTASPQ